MLRRPLAVVGFSFLGALIIASYFGFGISAALAAFCLVCAAAVYFGLNFFKYRITFAVVFGAAALAFAMFCIAENIWYAPVMKLDGKTAQISGVICEAPKESYGKYNLTVNADTITVDGKNIGIKTKLSVTAYTDKQPEPFDRVTAKVTLSAPSATNAAGFNSRLYYKSKGIYLFAKSDTVNVTHTSNKPPYYYAIMLRQYISGVISNYVGGDEGALADGILIGDTSNLPSQVKTDFTQTGISHILAVSGTQTSLIMEYLMLLLCAVRIRRRPAAAITAGAIVAFMAITGFSPSVMRAGIMSLVCLAGIIIKRDADVINSLGLSALALCIVNPFAATDVGLLLSLTATLGMVVLSGKINAFVKAKAQLLPERARAYVRAPLGILSETLGASLFTYPIILLVFGNVSLISLVSNMAEVPVSLFVTLATAVMVCFSPAPFLIFLIRPLALLIRIACAFMMWFAHLLANLPFATISAAYGFVNLFLAFAVIIVVLFFIFRKKGAAPGLCAACVSFVLAVGIFTYMLASKGVLSILSGNSQGDAIVISNGHAVVIGLSGKYPYTVVENDLKLKNIKYIDAVVLTSYDKKQAESLAVLENDMPVLHAYAPSDSEISTDTGYKEPDKISVPTMLTAPYGATITMLPDSNKEKMLALVSCNGSKAVITGNGDIGDYSAYNPQALKATVLMFGGSLDNSFVNAVAPSYAAGSSDADTLSMLLQQGAEVKNTSGVFMTRGSGNYTVY